MLRHRSVPVSSTRAWLVALILVAMAGTLRAHDFWIEPSAFMPTSGRIVGVRLRVGQDFVGDPVARDPARIEQFVATSRSGTRPVVGQDGADPAGLLRPGEQGLLVIAYGSTPSPIELPPDTFAKYLHDEGLDEVARTRSRAGLDNAPARELFSRCAKSLVQVGPVTAADRDRVVGLELELVAARNPYTLRPGDSLDVRLLYRGQPLAGALVAALNRQDAGAAVQLRTSREGRVRLPLRAAGPWLVKVVHMVAAPPGSGAEWRSFWASLTFEVPAGTPVVDAR